MKRAPCRARTGIFLIEGQASCPVPPTERECVAEESNPDQLLRRQPRFPLRQRRMGSPGARDPARDLAGGPVQVQQKFMSRTVVRQLPRGMAHVTVNMGRSRKENRSSLMWTKSSLCFTGGACVE